MRDLPELILRSSFIQAARHRVLRHAVFWYVFWPVFAVVHATFILAELPLFDGTPRHLFLIGCIAGSVRMLPEFMITATLLCACTVAVFASVVGRYCPADRFGYEAWLGFAAMVTAVALEYPGILSFPCFSFLSVVTAKRLLLFLVVAVFAGSAIFGAASSGWKGVFRCATAVAICGSLAWGLTQLPVTDLKRRSSHGAIAVIGLDSISQTDDLRQIREFAAMNNGRYYERAVTPGLLTNAVWTAIIMHRPVHETGVILTFQKPDWSRSPFQLINAAKEHGYETWSFFDDQFTTGLGTLGGFDHDRSGPLGWHQLATSTVKDGSILLPIIMSRLHLPLALTPANQANTYCFDLRAEIHEMLTVAGDRPSFIAAHIDYLHESTYPGLKELTPAERESVLNAKAISLRDLSQDWQYPKMLGEPLDLYEWKLRHIQQVVIDELKATGFTDPSNDNKLVLFSDHGRRIGLNNENFGDPKYYNVLLVTFGLPGEDVHAPVSLVDIPSMLGFTDARERMEPVVEYRNITEFADWQSLNLHWRGDATFGPGVLEKNQSRLKSYRPYQSEAEPNPARIHSVAPGSTDHSKSRNP